MSNILEEVQRYVADKLNADPQLSACPFLVENRKDIDYEIKNALGRQGIVGLVMTPKATFAGAYMDTSLAWQLDELEVDIVENVTVNRGKKNSGCITGQDAAMRLFNVLCPLSGEGEGKFCPVSLEEGEDGNLIVNKCILKCLVHVSESQPEPEPTTTVARYTDGSMLELNLSGTVQDWDVPKKNGEADLASVQLRFPVSELGNRAFNACYKLSAVSMPNSVSSIGQEAFQGCSSLVSVEVPSAVTDLDHRTFYMCTSLSSVTLPNQLSGIGILALGNTAIAELPKLENLSYINTKAFMDCKALTYMYIPRQTNIWPEAFARCTSLTCLAFEGKTTQEVQAMQYYPWGIEDTSVISAELG